MFAKGMERVMPTVNEGDGVHGWSFCGHFLWTTYSKFLFLFKNQWLIMNEFIT